MIVNEIGKVRMPVNPVQPEKAERPMPTNETGNTKLVRYLQPKNAILPIVVNDGGNISLFK